MTALIQTLSEEQRAIIITPIRTEADYIRYLAEIGNLLRDAPPLDGTPEADRLDVISILVEAWEARHHAIPALDPIQAIEARMVEFGMERGDLQNMLECSRGRLADLLNRRRPLSKAMMHKLASVLGLPVAMLMTPYEIVPPKAGGSAVVKE